MDRIAGLFDAHLGLIVDVCRPFAESWCWMLSASFIQIHDIYRDRVALEREYASKLQLLTKKAMERKNKAATSLVAGDSPTKPCSDSTIQQKSVHLLLSRDTFSEFSFDLAHSLMHMPKSLHPSQKSPRTTFNSLTRSRRKSLNPSRH